MVCPSVMAYVVIIEGWLFCRIHDGLDTIIIAPLPVPDGIAEQAGCGWLRRRKKGPAAICDSDRQDRPGRRGEPLRFHSPDPGYPR